MSTLNPESVLKEISVALHQRKMLSCQVNKLTTEVTTLERTTTLAPAFVSRPAVSITSSPHQNSFSTTVVPQNGLSIPVTVAQVQQSPTTKPPPPVQPQPRKSNSAGNIRRNQEWPDIPEIGKIEEKNPEILAKKILETGRQIEAGKYGTELTSRGQNTVVEKKAQSSEKSRNSSRISRPSSVTKLPSTTIAQSQIPTSSPPQPQQPISNTVISQYDSTPRGYDFEDRLKNLITSVLNDKTNPATASLTTHDPSISSSQLKQYTSPKFAEPEREGLFARAPLKSSLTVHHQHTTQQPDYTQFSPAKVCFSYLML